MKGERERERDKKKRLDLFGLARSNQKCDNNNAEKDIWERHGQLWMKSLDYSRNAQLKYIAVVAGHTHILSPKWNVVHMQDKKTISLLTLKVSIKVWLNDTPTDGPAEYYYRILIGKRKWCRFSPWVFFLAYLGVRPFLVPFLPCPSVFPIYIERPFVRIKKRSPDSRGGRERERERGKAFIFLAGEGRTRKERKGHC